MRLAIVLLTASLAVSAHAFSCFSCKSSSAIKGGVSIKNLDLPCAKFNGSSEYKQTCPEGFFGCVKITDPEDSTNVARGCVQEAEMGCKEGDPNCYCAVDLCNGSERGWPSAVLLLAAVIAALAGGR
ncbi:uncharacterized protein LOC122380417 [Amphibalanus amphitrite]|uniref:uncharacterized protein LOC122380417 n=1 Tax=Amphibalanus amphitrite TaxID=1232801 RepID=UPI001C924DA1|nr:uncharacterized protein LOC122380417 [Amphibalanus amphitrite]